MKNTLNVEIQKLHKVDSVHSGDDEIFMTNNLKPKITPRKNDSEIINFVNNSSNNPPRLILSTKSFIKEKRAGRRIRKDYWKT